MSYTIVLDQSEQRRQAENRLNVLVRHCRIGKVRTKQPKHWLPKMTPTGWHPSVGAPTPWWQYPSYPSFATPNTAG